MAARVVRFEDLMAWQKARLLTAAVYETTRKGVFAKDFGLSAQTQRAAVSIMSNLAEGFERNRLGEFISFYQRQRRHVQKSVPSCTSRSISATSIKSRFGGSSNRPKKWRG